MQKSDNKREKPRKSVPLTQNQLKALKTIVKKGTKEEVAELIGITRATLGRVLIARSANSETIEKINQAIAAKAALQ